MGRQAKPADELGQICRWVSRDAALMHFATYSGSTQSQRHIKPLHWYVACRLVLEGGFRPDEITPRPPFVLVDAKGSPTLEFDAKRATGGEKTILGGLKTKNVDVVVTKNGIGPVLAVSCKGMTGAFRNLTNRMEETIGECTNLHIAYPGLVFGYLFVIRANRRAIGGPMATSGASSIAENDIAIGNDGKPVESIRRFHAALRELTGRRGIRNDVSRYESIALAMVETSGVGCGSLLGDFPEADSPIRLDGFFRTLYQRYDDRYVFGAPELSSVTRRLAWSKDSLALDSNAGLPSIDYLARIEVESEETPKQE